MNGRIKWGAAGLILGLAVALSLPSFAQPTPAPDDRPSRTITVTGSATIRSQPDEAVVTVGVETQAAKAQEALQQNAARMSGVMKALLDLGIRQEDISTSGFSLWPFYDDTGLDIEGYTAQNQVSVTVRDMDRVGLVIDEAVAAGANLAGGVMFQLSDENEGIDRALAAAVGDARSKAEVLADAGDASLGEVIQITENSFTPGPVFFEDRAIAEGAPSTPIAPPMLETQVSVTVVWALV